MPDSSSAPDPRHEKFMRLLARHDPAVRAYVRAGVFSSHDVAEVMQEVSLVAWNKFDQLEDPDQGFGKWMCVIARYEILKFRQRKARDRMVLDERLIEKIAVEGIEETEERERWIEALDVCLQKLPTARRDLIKNAYQPESSIKAIAAEMKKKPDAVYQVLRRLRVELAKCIEKQLAPE